MGRTRLKSTLKSRANAARRYESVTKEFIEQSVREAYGNKWMPVGTEYFKGGKRWEVKLETDSVDFKCLLKLSKILGTDNIDVNNWREERGYCETCSYTAAGITIQIYDE